MAIYRTAQGKMIDMAALAAKNERTRAVGNLKVNARGDVIDRDGNIVQSVNEKINDQYAKTVGSRSAQVIGSKKNVASPAKNINQVPTTQLTDVERELEENFDDDIEVEKIKANELKGKK